MLFTILAATAATHAIGLRPGSSATNFAKLRDVTKSGSMDVQALHEVGRVVNAIMLQSGNGTEHLTSADQELLTRVIDIINNNMYASMNTAHAADVAAVTAAIAAINQCYQDFAARVADGGDLDQMKDSAMSFQLTLNDLQDDVDEKTIANNTAWTNFQNHISLISPAPACPALPNPRNMPSLDTYFSSSAYAVWWTAQRAAYWPVRNAWVEADRQLRVALTAYAVGLASRDVAYCDWKRELEAGCARYEACYEEKRAHYLNVVKPAVTTNMNARIEAYKAGETIIHQIKFLLAQEADQATPSISTGRYHIAFPAVPAKLECDMSALDDAMWVPTPECRQWVEIFSGGFCSTGWITGRVGGTSEECRADCDSDGQCGAYCFGTGNPEWDCLRYTSECNSNTVATVLHGHGMSAYTCYRFQEAQEAPAPAHAPPPCRPREDIIAGTFQHFGHDGASSSDQDCNQRCQSTEGCTAWVRGRNPGTNADADAHCWLTQQVPPVWEGDNHRVAGVPGCVNRPETTCGGNAGGAGCTFPFTYQGVTYSECSMANHHQLWCSLDAQYSGRWGNCEC